MSDTPVPQASWLRHVAGDAPYVGDFAILVVDWRAALQLAHRFGWSDEIHRIGPPTSQSLMQTLAACYGARATARSYREVSADCGARLADALDRAADDAEATMAFARRTQISDAPAAWLHELARFARAGAFIIDDTPEDSAPRS